MDNLHRELDAFLTRWRTASLATVDNRGQPHAADVWYVHDPDWRIYFVSDPASAHGRYVAVRPAVALTIYAPTEQPHEIHGLQLHGFCRVLEIGLDWDRVQRLYAAKYPFVNDPPMRQMVAAQCFYCVTPNWLRWVDNRRRFGFKVEENLATDERAGE